MATEEAVLYVYNVDSTEGGDLILYKQHLLDDTKDPQGVATSEPQSIEGESDKLREMAAATESPPKGGFHFNDDQEYPPLTQTSD